MNIVVSEYVCGGGWPTPDLPPSLQAEGAAMLLAVIEDLAALPNVNVLSSRRLGGANAIPSICETLPAHKKPSETNVPCAGSLRTQPTTTFPNVNVFSTWDRRLGPVPTVAGDVHFHPVNGPAEEMQWHESLCQQHRIDSALVIAPETDGILEHRCAWWRARGVPLLNAGADAIHIAGDKWLTYQICQEAGILTMETHLATDDIDAAALSFPCVVKLRDGAGSQEMKLLKSPVDWDQFRQRPDLARFILQPFVAERSLSVSAIVDRGQLRSLFPIGEQRFSSPHSFEYTGGRIPAHEVKTLPILELVKQVVTALPDLHGYIGFDLLLPHAEPECPRLMEINPRLTTAYIGYRALAKQNLSHWILDPGRSRPPEFHGAVSFHADGRIESHE